MVHHTGLTRAPKAWWSTAMSKRPKWKSLRTLGSSSIATRFGASVCPRATWTRCASPSPADICTRHSRSRWGLSPMVSVSIATIAPRSSPSGRSPRCRWFVMAWASTSRNPACSGASIGWKASAPSPVGHLRPRRPSTAACGPSRWAPRPPARFGACGGRSDSEEAPARARRARRPVRPPRIADRSGGSRAGRGARASLARRGPGREHGGAPAALLLRPRAALGFVRAGSATERAVSALGPGSIGATTLPVAGEGPRRPRLGSWGPSGCRAGGRWRGQSAHAARAEPHRPWGRARSVEIAPVCHGGRRLRPSIAPGRESCPGTSRRMRPRRSRRSSTWGSGSATCMRMGASRRPFIAGATLAGEPMVIPSPACCRRRPTSLDASG